MQIESCGLPCHQKNFAKGATDMSLIKHTFNLHNLHNIILSTLMMAVYGCQSMAKYGCLLSHIPVMVITTPNAHWYGRRYPYDGTVHMAHTVYS